MSILLQIFGRGVAVDSAELIFNWLATISENNNLPISQVGLNSLLEITELVKNRKYLDAKARLSLYLAENPECVFAKLIRAAVALCENDIKKSEEILKQIYQSQPSNTLVLYLLGHCYERMNAPDKAIEFYQDCLKFKAHLQLPSQRLAAIYLKNAQFTKAIQQYESLCRQQPDDLVSLVILGHLYLAAGIYESAIQTFNTAILIHPDNFSDSEDQIDQLIRQGMFYQALQQTENLLRLEPESPHLILKQADILRHMQDNSQALSLYQQTIRLCPDYLEAYVKMASTLLEMDQITEAAKSFNTAAEINDKIVDTYIGLAIAQKSAGDSSSALNTLSLAASIDTNSSVLYTRAATLQLAGNSLEIHVQTANQQNPERLISTLTAAYSKQLKNRPQNPQLYYQLGVFKMANRQMKNAADLFKAALEINPTYHRALNKLLICLFETGQPEKEILNLLQSPTSLERQTLELYYQTALLYCDRIKFASSLMNLHNSLDLSMTSSDPAVNISVVLQNLGLLDRATSAWENLSETTGWAKNIKHI